MATVYLENVTKVFSGNIIAVKKMNLKIEDKSFCVLVGPSGCGKSTTLRMIAGLEKATSGKIYIDEKVVSNIPPKNRDIAMVFQNYAIYPHMTVYNNLAFALKLRHYPIKEINNRVYEAAEILGIKHLLKRKPKALSGGQRQRVALGRAIVRKPRVFLFDEPLSNLDAKMRVQMRTEIKKLHEDQVCLEEKFVYDTIQAITLGDQIAVMKDGIVQQIAGPLELYEKPDNVFVAGFIGNPPMNFIHCKLIKKEEEIFLKADGFEILFSDDSREINLKKYIDKEIILGIRPEDIYDRLYARYATELNTIEVTVELTEPIGSEIYLHLSAGKVNFIARVDAHNKAQINQDIEIVFDMKKAHLFDVATGKKIV